MKEIIIRLEENWAKRHSTGRKKPAGELKAFVDSHKIKDMKTELLESSSLRLRYDEKKIDISAVLGDIIIFLKDRYKVSPEEIQRIFAIEADGSALDSLQVGNDGRRGDTDSGSLGFEGQEATLTMPSEEEMRAFYSAEPDQQACEDLIKASSLMSGAQELTALLEDIHRMAPVLRDRDMREVVSTRHYLFSIDEGCGLNRAAEILSMMLCSERLFWTLEGPINTVLPPPSEDVNVLTPLCEAAGQVAGRILMIDMSKWIDQAESEQFRSFISDLNEAGQDLIFLFRVPCLDQGTLSQLLSVLGDQMTVQPVSFVPPDIPLMVDIAEATLDACGMSAGEDAWYIFGQRLAEEKSDGRFYGFHSLNKIVNDMIYMKLRSLPSPEKVLSKKKDGKAGEESCPDICIEAEDIRGFVREIPGGPLAGNYRICGARMEKDINDLLDIMEAGRRPLHLRFTGDAGTGKTVAGRILTSAMRERGLLKRGYFIERSAAALLAEGESRIMPLIFSLFRDARGSVLFIDELNRILKNNEASPGAADKALGALLTGMKLAGEETVVILAGDEREMALLDKRNSAFAAEIPYSLDFRPFSREELADIFMDMLAGVHISVGEGLEEKVREYFSALSGELMSSPEFSNGRFVRNLFEEAVENSMMRVGIYSGECGCMEKADFEALALRDPGQFCAKTKKGQRAGYHIGLV